MVKMVLGSSDSQSTSVGTLIDNHTNGLAQLISALGTFEGAEALKGKAYQSAKDYSSSVLQPLAQGAILLAEALKTDVSHLPSRYRSEVGDEDLDEDLLIGEIDTLTTTIDNYASAISSLSAVENPSTQQIRDKSNAETAKADAQTKRTEFQTKLQKLQAFNSISPTIFDDLSSLESAVSQGLNQMNSDFEAFDGKAFKIPSASKMTWTTPISTAWEQRKRERLIGDVYKQVKNTLGSDAAGYISDAFKLLPTNLIKSIYNSEGFWEILSGIEKQGVTGKKAADAVLTALVKYEEIGVALQKTKLGKIVTKGGDYFNKIKKWTNPLKAGVSETLKGTKTYQSIKDAAKIGADIKGIKVLGKGLKIAGKATTVLTYADIAISGVSGGVNKFAETGDIGKGVIAGTFSAVKSVGPLEGATIGAAIGGPLGAGIGAAVGGLIWLGKHTKVFDVAEEFTYKAYDKTKEMVGKAVKHAGQAISQTFGGIGKALGFG